MRGDNERKRKQNLKALDEYRIVRARGERDANRSSDGDLKK